MQGEAPAAALCAAQAASLRVMLWKQLTAMNMTRLLRLWTGGHLRPKPIGTEKLCERPSGGAGNGEARRTIACTS